MNTRSTSQMIFSVGNECAAIYLLTIVFCDWGAMTFCDPERTVPEAARLLRPGGLFAFATGTPIQFLCQDVKTDRLTDRLINDYFGMHCLEWEDEVDFQ